MAKAALTARIAHERRDCCALLRELAPPLAILDRGIAWLRRLSPWVRVAGLAATFVAGRKLTSATRGSALVSLAARFAQRALFGALR